MPMSEPREDDVVILHVEDNKQDRLLLATALQELGIRARVISAENAVQAYNHMRLLRTDLPHLVVIDLNLPIFRGQQVLKDFKGDPYWKKVPAIVLSSSQQKKDIDDSLAAGAHAYVVKPGVYQDYLKIAKQMLTVIKQHQASATVSQRDLDRLAKPRDPQPGPRSKIAG